ncbi:family 1 glycosylhydrolase [Pannonibacter sp. Pt2-lr]
MPKGWENDFDVIGTPVDWCGLNYYTRKLIAPDPDSAWPSHKEVEGPLPKTQMGWEIYPEGLEFFLKRTHAEYTKGLPLYVTENGLANDDHLINGEVQDDGRIDFLDQHLAATRRAAEAGVPVKGYFLWSLMDNYEWAVGYEKRFGIVHTDFETLKRTPRRPSRRLLRPSPADWLCLILTAAPAQRPSCCIATRRPLSCQRPIRPFAHCRTGSESAKQPCFPRTGAS